MADAINIRLTKECPLTEVMDEAAKKLGMSRNELIVNGINLMVNFDTHFYKRLEAYSKRLNVPMWLAMQNLIIKRWAQDAAKSDVYGGLTEPLIEFMYGENGTITGKELYEIAYKEEFEKQAKERIENLEKEISMGLTLQGEDKEFYDTYSPKYGTKAPMPTKERNKHFIAYWEGEMSEEEGLHLRTAHKGGVKR